MMHHIAMIAAVAGTGLCAIFIAVRALKFIVASYDDIDWHWEDDE